MRLAKYPILLKLKSFAKIRKGTTEVKQAGRATLGPRMYFEAYPTPT